MKPLKLLSLFILISGSVCAQNLMVKDLTCEHKINPTGIDIIQPRLSWKIAGSGNNILQTAYSVRVATDPKFSSSKIIWESGKVASDESSLQIYRGPALKSSQRYFWQVKVWDNNGRSTIWS